MALAVNLYGIVDAQGKLYLKSIVEMERPDSAFMQLKFQCSYGREPEEGSTMIAIKDDPMEWNNV